jgi:DNA-binding transcriptional LysR family regulator
VALIAAGPALPPELATEVVVDERLVLAVSHSDALARRKTVSLDAIRDRALISLPRGTGLRAYLDDACKSAGFQPRIAFEVGDPRSVAQLASRGLGVTLLPESVTNAHPTQLRAIPLARPGCAGGSHSPGGRNSQPVPQPAPSSTTHAGNSPARVTPTVPAGPA